MTRLTSTKAYAPFAVMTLALALAAGCAQTDTSIPTGPSSFGANSAGAGGSASVLKNPTATATQSTTVAFSGFDAATLTVNIGTTTVASVGQPYIGQGKLQFQILVDATGKPVPCDTPGATYVRFDNFPNGGLNPDLVTGTTSTSIDLDNLFTTTNGEVKNVGCGDKICIRVHYVPGGGANHVDSHFSSDTPYEVVCNSGLCSGQSSQGYWKNHPANWPASVVSGGLMLGSVNYTAAQLQSIWGVPVAGNGAIALAHQLMAAKINIANGSNGASVAVSIAAADALIGGLTIPPVGSGWLAPGDTSALTQALDDFNTACEVD
jgi:hypothetical protein